MKNNRLLFVFGLILICLSALLTPQPVRAYNPNNVRISSSAYNQSEAKISSSAYSQVEITAQKMDNRAKILQAYLGQFDSPLQYHSQDFIDAADKFGLDFKLLPAIAGVESTFGKATPGTFGPDSISYNAWGWGVYGNQALYFKSWREAIFTISEGIKTEYIDKGLTDPYAMNSVYAASLVWGRNVTYFMRDIEDFQKEYENSSIAITPRNEIKIAGSSAKLVFKFP